ncbi:MAG: hypothetical protein COA78_09170 [Blastopirellula sp.]|nr:MAG: hypothetical protein COA78_09170 [Blastopirellula sp.]
MMPHISVRSKRSGAVALEFVITSFVLLIAIVGIIELSRAIMVNQVLINAAREGARNVVIPGATDESFDQVMDHYLRSAGIQPDLCTVEVYKNLTEEQHSDPSLRPSPINVENTSSHDEITVLVGVPFSDVSWGFMNFIANDTVLSAEVVMRKE